MRYNDYYLRSDNNTGQSIHCSIIRPKKYYIKNTSKKHELKVSKAFDKMCETTEKTLKKEVQHDN